MKHIVAHKEENKIQIFEANDFSDPIIEITEKNGLFVILDAEYDFFNDDLVIDIVDSKEKMEKSLKEYLSKYDYNPVINYIDNSLESIYETYEEIYEEDMDIHGDNVIEEILKFDKELSKIKEQIKFKLEMFNLQFIQPLYIEYKNRSRTSAKKIEKFEQLLNLNIEDHLLAQRELKDSIYFLENEIKKDEEAVFFIDTYIEQNYKKYIFNIPLDDDEEVEKNLLFTVPL